MPTKLDLSKWELSRCFEANASQLSVALSEAAPTYTSKRRRGRRVRGCRRVGGARVAQTRVARLVDHFKGLDVQVHIGLLC